MNYYQHQKLQEASPSNAFPRQLYANLLFIEYLRNLTVPNKQFFRVKLLTGLRGQVFNL